MLTPMLVLVIAAVMGLVRPSDIGMRAALVGDTMPADRLMGAMSIQRTTQDSARVAGALTGAGLVATARHGAGLRGGREPLRDRASLLTLKAGSARAAPHPAHGAADAPHARHRGAISRKGSPTSGTRRTCCAAMCLAFLLNLTAFPLFNGLLPYVAKEVYRADQTALGYMVAGAAFGALLGAIVMSRHRAVASGRRA